LYFYFYFLYFLFTPFNPITHGIRFQSKIGDIEKCLENRWPTGKPAGAETIAELLLPHVAQTDLRIVGSPKAGW
jgi:hypothetical protein